MPHMAYWSGERAPQHCYIMLNGSTKIIYSLADVNLETLKYIRWQPLMNVYKLKLTSLMYSVYYGLAPKYICDLFHKTEPQRYHLRRAEGLNVLKYNYSIGRTSSSYREFDVSLIILIQFSPRASSSPQGLS